MPERLAGADVPRLRGGASRLEDLDRFGWPAGQAVTAYGLRIGLRATKPAGLGVLLQRVPRVCKPSRARVVDRMYSLVLGEETHADGRDIVIYENEQRAARWEELEKVLEIFDYRLEMYIAEHARTRTLIHAAVVAWKGCAIVVPGRSMSGKTTLAAELVRQGATYFSDEFAVFDRHGRVHPYPRPLQIRENGVGRLHEVEALGGTQGTRPLDVGLVAFTRYKPGSRWRPRPFSLGRAVLEMLGNSAPARSHPQRTIETLSRVVRGAEVVKGVRGDAADAAEAILERVDALVASA